MILIFTFPVAGYGQNFLKGQGVLFNAVPLDGGSEGSWPALREVPGDMLSENLSPASDLSPEEYQSVHESIARYKNAIAEIEETEGVFSEALLQNLFSVAIQYEKIGEFELALVEFERAAYINRLNSGLYTEKQIQVSEHVMRLLGQLGRFDELGKKLDHHLYMHEKMFGPDDVRIVEALDKLAEWQFQSFQYSLSQYRNQASPMVNYFNTAALENSPQVLLKETQTTWLRAIGLLVEHNAFSNPLLHLMEDKLLETYFAHAELNEMLLGGNGMFGGQRSSFVSVESGMDVETDAMNLRNGANVYRRKLHYLEQEEELRVQDYARTLMQLGDWYLLFGNGGDARKTYRQAYEIMKENQVGDGELQAMFSPPVPVRISGAHISESGSSFAAGNMHRGYIDLDITVNKYGRSGKIKTLGASSGTARAVEKQLLSLLRDSRFRPRLIDGEFPRKDKLSLRFYYWQ